MGYVGVITQLSWILTFDPSTEPAGHPRNKSDDEVSEEPILELHLLPSKQRLLLLMPHSLQARCPWSPYRCVANHPCKWVAGVI